MVAELKNYQAQVAAYKSEIDRLNKCAEELKKTYFAKRDRQMREMNSIPEADEDGYETQQQMIG